MTGCKQCLNRNLDIHRAKAELARVARMCARRPNARNLALVAAAKETLAKQKRWAEVHTRTDHGGEAA